MYALYSGQLFFAAVALFAVAVAFDQRRPRRVTGFVALLSFPLAVLAAPPLPIAAAIVASSAALAYLIVRRRATAVAAIAASVLVVAIELPHHVRRPRIEKPRELFVIGDSLASGGFGERAPWPAVLARDTGIAVTNLALPSDDAATALQNQVPQLRGGATVIIEIGGNDMLAGSPVRQFETALDAMITAAGGEVILLELPLLPGRWSYGAAQRRVAAKHGSVLVPKRILARVLAARGNTSDGVHLTQAGHDALARDLAAWLRWEAH